VAAVTAYGVISDMRIELLSDEEFVRASMLRTKCKSRKSVVERRMSSPSFAVGPAHLAA
jgi:hypothetical protein